MTQNTFHLEIQSDPTQLSAVEEFIQEIAAKLNIDEEIMYGIHLTVSEAATNAIVHANKSNPAKKVTLNIQLQGEILSIKIKDEGPGFDPEDIPDPTSPENLLKDSGRGLYLMRIYTDSMKYNITDNGTELVLNFKI